MRSLWRRWVRWRQPEEAELDDAIANGRAVAAPQGAVRDLFAEVAAADLRDWDRVESGRWVAPLGDGDFRVLEMRAMKGFNYTLAWGVSLSYVPALPYGGPRFHRTAKSARIDVGEIATQAEPADIPVCAARWRVRRERGWWIRDEIETLWTSCAPPARSFWERAATPGQVLEVALAQADAPHIGHVPAPLLVAAFAAARAGDRARADDLLERALTERPDTPADAARRALARVAP